MSLNKPYAVSVVIPTYNREAFIEESVESALSQRLDAKQRAVEVIVIDDGSSDNTSKIIKKFGNKIRYRRINNSGKPAVVRNIGVQMAKGELIAFLDSDDKWLPNRLSSQMKYFSEPSVALASANAYKIDQDGCLLNETILPVGKKYGHNPLQELILDNYICTLTVLARRDAILAAGGFNESLALNEDYALWLRLAAHGKFIYSPVPIALYRIHADNITNLKNMGVQRAMEAVYRAIKDGFDAGDYSKEYRKLYLARLANLSRQLEGLDPKHKTTWKIQNFKYRLLLKTHN